MLGTRRTQHRPVKEQQLENQREIVPWKRRGILSFDLGMRYPSQDSNQEKILIRENLQSRWPLDRLHIRISAPIEMKKADEGG
jgi:hypothetical protein